jgi:guanosine-3',5'-bis(diphosphate) 3'-pyrophosphohydrolase
LLADDGREKLERRLRNLKVDPANVNINELLLFYKVPTALDLYHRIAIEAIDLKNLREFFTEDGQPKAKPANNKPEGKSFEDIVKNVRGSSDMLVIGENIDRIDYKLSPCCNPIPGDDVFGFITINEGIKIHRTNCPNAIQLMSNYGYRIVKARWTGQQEIAFLAGIRINGADEVGVVNNITRVISNELKVNMRSISIDSNEGLFEGTIMLFVHDTEHLKKLMAKLGQVNGILSVTRIDPNQ